jgi:outer membrane protein assembly factor BamB
MSSFSPSWLNDGQGIPPTVRWSFATDAALVALDMGSESGEVLAADESGGMYRLDRRGRLLTMTRGWRDVRALAWSDTNAAGAVIVGERKVVRVNGELEAEWSINLPEPALGVAVTPFGNHTAISLANGGNVVLGPQSEQISIFETIRPQRWIQFLASQPVLIGAAEYGQVCAHQLNGRQLWSERTFTSLGEMHAAANGETILLAAFNQGIQSFGGNGSAGDSYLVEGTASRVSCSFNADRIAVATMERHLYWLDSDGQLLWATQLDDDVVRVLCDPLGEWLLCGLRSGQIVRLDWES